MRTHAIIALTAALAAVPAAANGQAGGVPTPAPPTPASTPPPSTKPMLSTAQRLGFEGLGEALILPGGRVVYEYLPPYRDRASSGVDDSRANARLMVLDPGAATPRPLFRPDPRLGYEIVGVSPSGTRLALRVTGSDAPSSGAVVDIATGRLTPLQYAPYGDFEDSGVTWLSDDALIYGTAPLDRDPPIVSRLRPAAADAFRREWTAAFEGKRTTADVLRSRSHDVPAEPKPGELIRADARTGQGVVLAQGLLLNLKPSPSGRYVAAIRRHRNPLSEPRELWPVIGERSLAVAQTGAPGALEAPCDGCDVVPDSVVWDTTGDTLYFYARARGAKWRDGHYYRYVPGAGPAMPIDLHGLKPAGWFFFTSMADGEETKPYAPVPLEGGIAVAVDAPAPTQSPTMPTAATGPYTMQPPRKQQWVQIRADGTTHPLSGTLACACATPIAYTPRALYLLGDGRVWRLSADAAPVALTPESQRVLIAQPVRRGTTPLLGASPHAAVAGAKDKAGLVLVQAIEGTAQRAGYLDLDSGASMPLAPAAPGGRVVAASLAGDVALVTHTDASGITLARLDAHGEGAPFVQLNRFMAGLAWPRRQQVHYKVDGRDLQACVLSDPTRADTSRTPIIAYLYPLIRGACDAPSGAPSLIDAMGVPDIYTPEFLVGLGYTVVSPAAPLDLMSTPNDAESGMSRLVDAAVDATGAAALGDSTRVGLFGISQGGFTVLKTVTESGRYRAAVAGWSASDYASDYTGFGPVRGMLQTIWADGRRIWYPNNGLAAPPEATPWGDPQWFIKSSPYFNSAKITTPLLIAQSDLDANFPMSQFDELFTSLYIQRKDVDYVRYWGEGHGATSPANMQDFADRVRAFFTEKLGPAR